MTAIGEVGTVGLHVIVRRSIAVISIVIILLPVMEGKNVMKVLAIGDIRRYGLKLVRGKNKSKIATPQGIAQVEVYLICT